MNITDLTPLVFLNEIEELEITNNRIKDISPLSLISSLKSIRLAGNDIRDFSSIPTSIRIWGANWQQNKLKQTLFLKECLILDTLPKEKRITIEALRWKTMVEDCDEANLRLLT